MNSAILIDVVRSRDYTVEQRGEIQRYIARVCAALNGVFGGELVRGTDFSAGDEIQGLFRSPWGAYLYVRLFKMLLCPVAVRAGIGAGTWDVRMENAGTTAQDGQVYHRARQAIVDAADQDMYDVLYCSGGDGDAAVNSLIAASEAVRGTGRNQNELALLTELLSPLDCGGCIDAVGFDELWKTGAGRREYRYFNEYLPERSPFDLPCPGSIKPVDAAEADGYFITAGRPRGLPVTISDYMGGSRQNVYKMLKTSDIFTSRALAISALRAMKMTWNDGEE